MLIESWLQSFNPNVEDLLNLLLPQLDDTMLEQIAAADYGSDVALHLAPLKLFRNERIIPKYQWHPFEVLELIRWSEPDQPGWRPGDEGERGHLLRAFACAMLLISYDLPENQDVWHSFNETAIQLTDSLRALDNISDVAGASFLAWCVDRLAPLDKEGIEGAFLGLALLTLTARLAPDHKYDITGLCAWISRQVEALLPERQWQATRRHNWLLSVNHHNQRNSRWVEVGRELYHWAEAHPSSEQTTWVALIGRALAEE